MLMTSRNYLILCSAIAFAITSLNVDMAAAQSIESKRGGWAKKDFPKVKLYKRARGEEAIALLGSNIEDVAKWHKRDGSQLRKMLKRDRSLVIDQEARLLYVDEIPILESVEASGISNQGSSTPANGPLFPLDQTFLLHSRLGSKKTIYLDFDGHVIPGGGKSAWGSYVGAVNDVALPPFDTNGNPAVFSDAERTVIQKVWQRVSEDFAPFDVDVTTQEPPADSLTRTSLSDDRYGNRALITPTSTLFPGAGGVSFVSVFDDTTEYAKIALVFPNRLGNSEKHISEAVSHELGHSLGLSHQGTASAEYYYGQGSWAPIMGVGYNKTIVQWSKGEYANSSNKEDELKIMNAIGLAYFPDDYGNTFATAYQLTADPAGQVELSGAIEQNTDIDAFKLTMGAGQLILKVSPSVLGANLNARIELYNASGVMLNSADPAGVAAAQISATLPGGTYYLLIKNVGEGDPLITGYSAYGSLGQYKVQGSIAPSALQPPVAKPSANYTTGPSPLTVQFNSSTSSDPDGSIVSVLWSFGDSTTSTEANPTKVYKIAGQYNVTLNVTDNDGLSHSMPLMISVQNKSPQPVISSSSLTGITPLSVDLDASGSKDDDGTIASYAWDFGDGTTGSGAKVSHNFASAGTYTVRLTVVDNLGAEGSSSVVVTTTAPVLKPPVAQASANYTTGPSPLRVQFNSSASSDTDGTIASVLWNFGDGTTSTAANPSKVFKLAGQYNVTLKVTDNDGLSHSTSLKITVQNKAPQPVIVASSLTGTSPLTVNFDGSSSKDDDGTVVSYAWDFGDGTAGAGAKPSHTYTAAGTYTAKLTVVDNMGSEGSTSVVINSAPIVLKPPVAQASANYTTGPSPLTVQFNSSASSDADGTIASVLWNFGDGTTSTTANPSKVFKLAGQYNVTLKVTDNDGLSHSTSLKITVQNKAPQPVIVASSLTGTSPLTVNFDGSSSKDDDGTVVSYAWDFGDGTTGSGAKPSHIYAAAGTYTVKLKVVDNLGAEGSVSEVVTITSSSTSDVIAAPNRIVGWSAKGVTTLGWKDNSNNEEGFYVERAKRIKGMPLEYQRVKTVPGNTTLITMNSPLGTFFYRVQAFNTTLGKTSGYTVALEVSCSSKLTCTGI